MFKKRFINILYESIYKITQEARFDWKHFKNIYKIAEKIKVLLTVHIKCLNNIAYQMFLKPSIKNVF